MHIHTAAEQAIATMVEKQNRYIELHAAGEYPRKGDDFDVRAKRVGRDLRNFSTILHNIPPMFTLRLLRPENANPAITKSKRTEFESQVRKAFFVHVAKHEKHALKKMGLNNQQIALLAKGATVGRLTKKTPLDITVDHDHDLSLGGDNNFRTKAKGRSNLKLVPHHINHFRFEFTRVQKIGGEVPARGVLVLEFKGQGAVPVFKGGFRPRNGHMRAVHQRIAEDLGIELEL